MSGIVEAVLRGVMHCLDACGSGGEAERQHTTAGSETDNSTKTTAQ